MTTRTIWRTCECGKLNQEYQSKKVHKRYEKCPACNTLSIKRAFQDQHLDFIFEFDSLDVFFTEYAIAWG